MPSIRRHYTNLAAVQDPLSRDRAQLPERKRAIRAILPAAGKESGGNAKTKPAAVAENGTGRGGMDAGMKVHPDNSAAARRLTKTAPLRIVAP
jgi:hypothetical protein